MDVSRALKIFSPAHSRRCTYEVVLRQAHIIRIPLSPVISGIIIMMKSEKT
jgi:hypothetical protein